MFCFLFITYLQPPTRKCKPNLARLNIDSQWPGSPPLSCPTGCRAHYHRWPNSGRPSSPTFESLHRFCFAQHRPNALTESIQAQTFQKTPYRLRRIQTAPDGSKRRQIALDRRDSAKRRQTIQNRTRQAQTATEDARRAQTAQDFARRFHTVPPRRLRRDPNRPRRAQTAPDDAQPPKPTPDRPRRSRQRRIGPDGSRGLQTVPDGARPPQTSQTAPDDSRQACFQKTLVFHRNEAPDRPHPSRAPKCLKGGPFW